MQRKQQYQRPIDYLKESEGQVILIKVKRNRLFSGTLGSFDDHLNLFIKNCAQLFEYQDEEGNLREERENLGDIVIRGDNVIFVNLATR
jgi:small nuclear ribonucleoprotein (snRNP)-like protein